MVICDIVSVVVVRRGVVMEGGDENFSRALQEMHVDNSESHIRQVDDKPDFPEYWIQRKIPGGDGILT